MTVANRPRASGYRRGPVPPEKSLVPACRSRARSPTAVGNDRIYAAKCRNSANIAIVRFAKSRQDARRFDPGILHGQGTLLFAATARPGRSGLTTDSRPPCRPSKPSPPHPTPDTAPASHQSRRRQRGRIRRPPGPQPRRALTTRVWATSASQSRQQGSCRTRCQPSASVGHSATARASLTTFKRVRLSSLSAFPAGECSQQSSMTDGRESPRRDP
jgi:hypothetical protein